MRWHGRAAHVPGLADLAAHGLAGHVVLNQQERLLDAHLVVQGALACMQRHQDADSQGMGEKTQTWRADIQSSIVDVSKHILDSGFAIPNQIYKQTDNGWANYTVCCEWHKTWQA